MNEIKVFENPAFGQVRTMDMNGEPWFVGKDVAESLGYKNTKDAVMRHVDAEDTILNGVEIPDPTGRMQTYRIINESGLYSLILSSKLPTAKAFKRWVTAEILPSISRTGGYIAKTDQSRVQLAEQRANAMMLNAKSRAAKQMMQLWTAAGVEPAYQALALNGFYDGLEIPRAALQEATPALYDQTTIADKLGILSSAGNPHAMAVGAIISQLTLLPEESTETPYFRNGHDGIAVQYTESVLNKVRGWLAEHDRPTQIMSGGKCFKVKYQT